MNRRNFICTLPALSACGRRGNTGTIEGRWEGKLTNGASSMTLNLDFVPKPNQSFELRANCRDLFLATHPLQTWRLEGSAFSFTLPLIEGPRTYTGTYGGPTFDTEYKPAEEKLHLRRLGHVPALPYRETGLTELTPTQRSVRATARIFGKSEALLHFNADLLARLGIATTAKPVEKAGWVFTEDMDIPQPPKTGGPEFAVFLSPTYERIPAIAAFECPIFVVLGESDSRNTSLERGSRQIAYDLRETLARKRRAEKITVIPKADQTFRIPGYGREYPRLSPQHIEYFRLFFSRFEAKV